MLEMIPKEDRLRVFETWLFWTGVVRSLTVLMAIIGNFVRICINVRGKFFLSVYQYIYFNNSLSNKQNN